MEYGYGPDQDPYSGQNNRPADDSSFSGQAPAGSSLSAGAMILAVLSSVLILFIYFSVPLAAIAIILALLSRGREPLSGRARSALIIAIAAMTASIGITSFAMYQVWKTPALRSRMQQVLDYYTNRYDEADNSSWLDEYLANEAEKNNRTRLPENGLSGQPDDAAGASGNTDTPGSPGEDALGGTDGFGIMPPEPADIRGGSYT